MSIFVLIGFAAIAIDLSVGFNQRRQDQTAADIGVMAGAIETLGPNTKIRDLILDFTLRNVVATYSSADWQARWEGCTDPERATLNASGFSFVPVTAPAGWSPAVIDCISIDAGGFVRVNLPELEFDTTFGGLLGVDQLQTKADAVARIASRGGGSILPFGLLVTAGEGENVCLRDTAGGISEPPCDGTNTGNFGAILSPHYGSQPDGPAKNCTGSPKSDVIAVNIAYGIDHRIIPDPDGLTANEVLDTCTNMDNGLTPDTLDTFTGISQGVPQGLATGPVPGGITDPLLQQGANPKRNVYGYSLDDKPLWEYIDPSLSASTAGVDIPVICERVTFDNSNPQVDWDGDGTLDDAESWEHLSKCLETFVNGDGGGHPAPYTTPLFVENLKESPRFGYVPQFWEDSWPSGTSAPRHVWRFKATWLQTTWWKKGTTTVAFNPGESGTFSGGGNHALIQLSGIIIPDAALPNVLRGNPPPGGGVNPFKPELYR
jgi:hypothetical protein